MSRMTPTQRDARDAKDARICKAARANQDLSFVLLAERFGVPENHIRRVLREAGIKRVPDDLAGGWSRGRREQGASRG